MSNEFNWIWYLFQNRFVRSDILKWSSGKFWENVRKKSLLSTNINVLTPWAALTLYGAHFFRAKSAHWHYRTHIDSLRLARRSLVKIGTKGVFRITEYEFWVQISKFKMADILWWTGNLKKLLYSDENWYSKVFEVSDYKSTLKIRKFSMPDQNVKICLIRMKIITRGFSKSLIVNLYFKFRNSKWQTEI